MATSDDAEHISVIRPGDVFSPLGDQTVIWEARSRPLQGCSCDNALPSSYCLLVVGKGSGTAVRWHFSANERVVLRDS